MFSTELINLHINMCGLANYSVISLVILPAIPPAISLAFIVFTFFALAAFIEYKNLFLKTLCLAIGSYMTLDNILTIWIYDYLFTF